MSTTITVTVRTITKNTNTNMNKDSKIIVINMSNCGEKLTITLAI